MKSFATWPNTSSAKIDVKLLSAAVDWQEKIKENRLCALAEQLILNLKACTFPHRWSPEEIGNVTRLDSATSRGQRANVWTATLELARLPLSIHRSQHVAAQLNNTGKLGQGRLRTAITGSRTGNSLGDSTLNMMLSSPITLKLINVSLYTREYDIMHLRGRKKTEHRPRHTTQLISRSKSPALHTSIQCTGARVCSHWAYLG